MIVPVNAFEFPRVKKNENVLTALQVTPDVTRDDLVTDPFASFQMESPWNVTTRC